MLYGLAGVASKRVLLVGFGNASASGREGISRRRAGRGPRRQQAMQASRKLALLRLGIAVKERRRQVGDDAGGHGVRLK